MTGLEATIGALILLAVVTLIAKGYRGDRNKPQRPQIAAHLVTMVEEARAANFAQRRIVYFTERVERHLDAGNDLQAYDWLRVFGASLSLFKGEVIPWGSFSTFQRESLILEAHDAVKHSTAKNKGSLSIIAGEALLHNKQDRFEAVQYRVALLNQRLPEHKTNEKH
ncbi:VHS1016 protein [Vibrio phage 1]|nr:VHS1016 protein [Vibrio phage 1]